MRPKFPPQLPAPSSCLRPSQHDTSFALCSPVGSLSSRMNGYYAYYSNGVSMRELFGLTVKHAAIIFAFIYGAGFLVLSIHHARFGMETTEPFKPKVFLAGVLFVVLAGAPWAALRQARGRLSGWKTRRLLRYLRDFWDVIVLSRVTNFSLDFVSRESQYRWRRRRVAWRCGLSASSFYLFAACLTARYQWVLGYWTSGFEPTSRFRYTWASLQFTSPRQQGRHGPWRVILSRGGRLPGWWRESDRGRSYSNSLENYR